MSVYMASSGEPTAYSSKTNADRGPEAAVDIISPIPGDPILESRGAPSDSSSSHSTTHNVSHMSIVAKV